jgi:hypothetical protein
VVRALIGKPEHPRTAHCIGGLYEDGAPTDQKTPNTQYATYQYADGTEIHCDLRNWYAGPPEAQGVFVFGSKGWMKVGDGTAQVYFGRKNEPGPAITADEKRDPGQSHFENFIECMRTRRSADLRAPTTSSPTCPTPTPSPRRAPAGSRAACRTSRTSSARVDRMDMSERACPFGYVRTGMSERVCPSGPVPSSRAPVRGRVRPSSLGVDG